MVPVGLDKVVIDAKRHLEVLESLDENRIIPIEACQHQEKLK